MAWDKMAMLEKLQLGEITVQEYAQMEREAEANDMRLSVGRKGTVVIGGIRARGAAYYPEECYSLAAALGGDGGRVKAFIESDPWQYHPAGKDDEGVMRGAIVVRLSKGKGDKVVMHTVEDADAWVKKYGHGPVTAATRKRIDTPKVEKGEVTAKAA